MFKIVHTVRMCYVMVIEFLWFAFVCIIMPIGEQW